MNKLPGKSKGETKNSKQLSLGQLLFLERIFCYVVGMCLSFAWTTFCRTQFMEFVMKQKML